MQTRILTTLQNKLASIPKTKITLNADVLTVDSEARGVSEITLDWALFFGSPELNLYNVTLEEPDTNGNLSLRGTVLMLRYEEIPVRVRFFLSERLEDSAEENSEQSGYRTHLECLIEVEKFPDTWELTHSYPDMPGYMDFSPERLGDGEQPSLLKQVELRECNFIYSSLDFARKAERRKKAILPPLKTTLLEEPKLNGYLLEKGLNFRANLIQRAPVFDKTLTFLLAQLGTTNPLPVYGSLARYENGLYMYLYHDLTPNKEWNLREDGTFQLSLERIGLVNGIAGFASGNPMFQIDAVLGNPNDLEFAVNIYKSLGSNQFVLEGNFEDGKVFSIDRVLNLVGQQEMINKLPKPIQKVKEIGLQYLFTRFSLPENSLKPEIESLNLRLSSTDPWKVLPNKIHILPILLWNTKYPFNEEKRKIEFQIGGTCILGKTYFDVLVIPETKDVMINMAVGSSLDADAVLSKIFPGLSIPEITILDLDLNANLDTGDFMAVVDAKTSLNFNVGGTDLQIKAIQLNIESNQDKITGILQGELEVAGWEVSVEFALEEEWMATVEIPELPVSSLAEQFLSKINLPIDIPEFSLIDVVITVFPKTGAFSVYGASKTPLSLGKNINATLAYFEINRIIEKDKEKPETKKIKYTSMIGIDLAFGSFNLELNAEQTGEQIGKDAVWTYIGSTGENDVLKLSELIDKANGLAGTTILSSDEIPELEFKDVQLTYTPKTKIFEFLGKCKTPINLPFGKQGLTFELEIRSSSKDPNRKYEGILKAKTSFAGTDISLSAFIAKDIEWRATITSISLNSVTKELEILDSISPTALQKMTLKNLDIRFTPKTNESVFEADAVTSTGTTTYTIFSDLPIEVSELRIQIRKLKAAEKQIRFIGKTKFDSYILDVEIEFGANSYIRAKTPKLNLGSFINPLFGSILEKIGLGLPVVTSFLKKVEMANVTLSISPTNNTISLSGSTEEFTSIELRAKKYPKEGWSFAMGASFAKDFSFAKLLGDSFKLLDEAEKTGIIKLSESALLLSPNDNSSSQNQGFESVKVPGDLAPAKGLSIATPLDLTQIPTLKLFGIKTKINVLAVIGDPGNLYFAVKLAEKIIDTVILEFNNLELRVKPFPPIPAYGLAGNLILKKIDPTQNLNFQLAGIMTPVGGEFEGRLEKWDKPFGIPKIKLESILIKLYQAGEVIVPKALSGTVKLGNVEGEAGFAFDKKNPINLAFILKFNEISLSAILEAFLPSSIKELLEQTNIIKLKNVNIRFVTTTFESYEQGVSLDGNISLGLSKIFIKGKVIESKRLILNGTYTQDLNLPIPALSIKIPLIGKVPVWPNFTLSAGLSASIEIELNGSSFVIKLTGIGFEWSGSHWNVPNLNLSLPAKDFLNISKKMDEHILKNVEKIFKSLIDEIKNMFEDTLTNPFKKAGELLGKLNDFLKDSGLGPVAEIGEVGEFAFDQLNKAAEQVEKQLSEAAKQVAKVMEKIVGKAGKVIRSALKSLEFWNWF